MIFADAKKRFSNRAADYASYRPRYRDYKRVKDACPELQHLRTFFGGDHFVSRDLPKEQVLDWESLYGLLRSNSFAPTEGHPNYVPMMKEVERIYRAHERDGCVRIQYWTRICFGQLQPG